MQYPGVRYHVKCFFIVHPCTIPSPVFRLLQLRMILACQSTVGTLFHLERWSIFFCTLFVPQYVSKPYSRCSYIFSTSTPVSNFHIAGRQVIGLTWSLSFNINTVRPSIGHAMWYQINFLVNTHSVDLQCFL